MDIAKACGQYRSVNRKNKIYYLYMHTENPKAIIQIEHGIAEHLGRYEELIELLAEKGYAVFANDHLGHGRTARTEEELCWFGSSKGWKTVCQDIWYLHDYAVEQFPDIPYFLMGHSMGSFLARTIAISHSDDLDGLILSGTGHQNGLVIFAGKIACLIERIRIGSKGHSKLINLLSFGSYNRPFKPNRTPYDWLTRDEAEVDKYIEDPLCGMDATVGLFSDLLKGLNIIRKPKNIAKMRKDLPIYMFSGACDPVGDMSKGVKKVYGLFKDNGISDVTLKLYENGRHEMLNGPDRDKVIEDLLQWVESKL